MEIRHSIITVCLREWYLTISGPFSIRNTNDPFKTNALWGTCLLSYKKLPRDLLRQRSSLLRFFLILFCFFQVVTVILNENFVPNLRKFLTLDFLGVSWVYHIEFHEMIKTPFTVCKYLHWFRRYLNLKNVYNMQMR